MYEALDIHLCVQVLLHVMVCTYVTVRSGCSIIINFYSWWNLSILSTAIQNELRALSQYNDSAYFPNVDHYKHTIQIKVENFFKEHLQETLNELQNYIIDFFVSPDKVK